MSAHHPHRETLEAAAPRAASPPERWEITLPGLIPGLQPEKQIIEGHVEVDRGVLLVERERPSPVIEYAPVHEPVLYLAPGTWAVARKLPRE